MNNLFGLLRWSLHSLIFTVILSTNALAAPLTPQELFSDDRITNFAVSPTGEYIAYVAPQDNTEIFTIAKVDGMKPLFTTKLRETRFVGRIRWANNTRLLMWPAKRYGIHKIKYLTGELQAMNFDGSKNTKLWGYEGKIRQGRANARSGRLVGQQYTQRWTRQYFDHHCTRPIWSI